MGAVCSPFLFHAVLTSLHATKLLRHDVGNCPLYKELGEDTSGGGHAAELPKGVWRDGGVRKAELPGQDVGAPLAGKETAALATVGRFMSHLVCSRVKASIDLTLIIES